MSVHELGAILEGSAIATVFQPVVDLTTRAVAGYEALSRGPTDSPLRAPDDLFAAAREADRLAELDWRCRVTALRTALDADIRPPLTLFLNVEPEVLSLTPDWAGPVLARAAGGLRVVVELTERALLARPGALLRFVERVRRQGWGLAVDDVGADPQSLALLSVVEPDVVKLDVPLLRSMPTSLSTAVVSGVQTYRRRTGARVVAEGLEDQDDIETAHAVGAQYGQGWQLGRPAAVTAPVQPTTPVIPMISPRPHLPTRRLIHLLTRSEPAARADAARVESITGYLFEHAGGMGPNTLVVACVQRRELVTPKIREGLLRLSARVAHVALLGADLPPEPLPGIRGMRLTSSDPLQSEWVVATIGLQEAIGLVASDLGDAQAGPSRRYDYALT